MQAKGQRRSVATQKKSLNHSYTTVQSSEGRAAQRLEAMYVQRAVLIDTPPDCPCVATVKLDRTCAFASGSGSTSALGIRSVLAHSCSRLPLLRLQHGCLESWPARSSIDIPPITRTEAQRDRSYHEAGIRLCDMFVRLTQCSRRGCCSHGAQIQLREHDCAKDSS